MLIIAGAMVLLMGIIAIAVDIGFGQSERRIDQTGADAAALAGSLELVISDEANGLEASLDRVYEIVDTNLGRTVAYADWAACSDPDALYYSTLTDLGASNGSDCVSLSEDFNTLRVRLPYQAVDTYFAPVIGSDSINVSAAAEAERNAEFGGGGNVPFYVLDGTGVGTELCIKTGTNDFSSCGSPSSGSFGDFVPYFYGPVGGDLSTICNKAQQPRPLARAIAMGIDHEFSRFAPFPGGTERVNGSWCASGVPGPLLPNTIQPGSGYSANDITWGLVEGERYPGSQSFPGRLTRDDASVTAQDMGSASVFGHGIDNRPLWDYIDLTLVTPSLPGCDFFNDPANQGHVPTTPAIDVVPTYNLRRANLIACLGEAHTNGVRILSVDRDANGEFDILETPRVGAAPKIWEDFFPPNNNFHMHIQNLSPIFIESLYADIANPHFQCNGLDNVTWPGVCVHRAGIDGSMIVTSPGAEVFQSVGAIVLSCEIMPVGTCPTLQDPSGTGLTFLYDLQLTR
ncbi:MAG: Tad domain-containing protein [Acidimicrobiia bacterium]